MTDLIQRAEALEANATVAEHAAKSQHADAERWRAEAAKLREQAREPLRLWVNIHPNGKMFYYDTPEFAMSGMQGHVGVPGFRIAVPMVEVRPVRIAPEHEQQAWQIFNDTYGFGAKPWRAVMEYALSLAGVEVEK